MLVLKLSGYSRIHYQSSVIARNWLGACVCVGLLAPKLLLRVIASSNQS